MLWKIQSGVIVIITLLIFQLVSSAEPLNPEYYFRFDIINRSEIDYLTRVISIDNVTGKTVHAYANPEELIRFQSLGYHYELLPHPGTLYQPRMAQSRQEMRAWDKYPSYETYLALLNDYATTYPSICRLDTIGRSVQGRYLLAVKISNNVNVNEDEPEFFLTSTMHGDETVGFILMLRLIEYLLVNYHIDDRLRALIDNSAVWINPLSNPDATYRLGNSSVYGATRYNANGVDLNRNFPDPAEGEHPTAMLINQKHWQ